MSAKRKPSTGRPTRLNADLQERICEGVRLGLPYAMAAAAAGVPERTFYWWKQRGEEDEGSIYGRFLQALKTAEAEGARNLLGMIRGAALGSRDGKRRPTGQWQAAAWILERRHPELFGRRQAIEVNATPDDVGQMTETRIASMVAAAQRKMAGD